MVQDSKRAIRSLRLLRLFSRYRAYVPLLVLLGVVGSLAESVGISLIVLLLNAMLGDLNTAAGMVGGTLGRFNRATLELVNGRTALLAGLVVLLIVARSLSNVVYALLGSWLRHSLSEDVRNHIHGELFDLPYAWVREREMGELMTVLSADSWVIADTTHALTRIGTNVISIVIFGAFVVAISPSLALIAAVGSLLIFAVVERLGRRARTLGEKALAANIALTDRILAGLQGMRTLRAFGMEDAEKERFRRASCRARTAFTAIDRLQAMLSPLTEISYLALLATLVVVSAPLGVAVPATMTAVLLLYRLQPHLRELEGNRLALIGHEASLRQVRDVLGLRSRGVPRAGDVSFTGLKGSIRFEKVGFAYAGTDTLVVRNLDIEIRAGGVTVIAGPSGVGKTTIIGLLLRLYLPTNGQILVDGVRLEDLSRPDWLARVALAGQDADLIVGTIADNLRLGRLTATDDELREAAELAGIAGFIADLPEGFETEVGDRGLNISGGQRQRIGLARAVLRNPDILILDEATNALEDQLELEIFERLRERFANRTIILITHRAGGLPKADHVITLKTPAAVEPAQALVL